MACDRKQAQFTRSAPPRGRRAGSKPRQLRRGRRRPSRPTGPPCSRAALGWPAPRSHATPDGKHAAMMRHPTAITRFDCKRVQSRVGGSGAPHRAATADEHDAHRRDKTPHVPAIRCNHEAVRGHQEAIEMAIEMAIGRPSGGHREAIRRPSGGHQEAIRRPSGGHQEAIEAHLGRSRVIDALLGHVAVWVLGVGGLGRSPHAIRHERLVHLVSPGSRKQACW